MERLGRSCLVGVCHLAFADYVYEFNAALDDVGVPNRFEAHHRPNALLDVAMSLLCVRWYLA